MSGFSALGINLPVLLAQLINFILLFVVLYLLAYKPVTRMLDNRSKQIRDSMEQTEAIKQQSANAEENIRKQLEAASKEGQERIARASRAGEELRQKTIEDSHKEAEAMIVRARGEIKQERDAAIGEIRKEFADLTILAAEKVIDRSLDKKAHQDIIDKVLKESETLK